MTALSPLLAAAILGIGLATSAAADPPPLPDPATPAAPAPTVREMPALPPPSPTFAALRVLGALVIVGMLLAGVVMLVQRSALGPRQSGTQPRGRTGLAWLIPRAAWRSATGERIQIESRSYLGPRESVGVIAIDRERFLIGIAGGAISLLARLEAAPVEAEPRDAADFTEVLNRGAAAAAMSEGDFREAIQRSRDRLARLEHRLVDSRGARA